ncbi:MAG: NAD-dependent epimerase/dehydratase family protein [Clostridiales bacterium]|nr:NAD-dependent epimerase/dehydratase family protein [Clostridiales bacterium]
MNILVLGGTRFFGLHIVRSLLKRGHKVTIATRGNKGDDFGTSVNRIHVDHLNAQDMKQTFANHHYDVVYDNICYCSNDLRAVLDAVSCDRFILMSTTAVYELHNHTVEEDYKPEEKELIWCDREAFSYGEVKRLAECALRKQYVQQNAVAVRYPFVIGEDDYTERLKFYVEHVMKETPMNVDNLNNQMSFIRSCEAGDFLACLADKEYTGAINGCNDGTISLYEIISYVEEKTGKRAQYSLKGDEAPYNGTTEYSIDTQKARGLGYSFTNLKDWIYELIDFYIDK